MEGCSEKEKLNCEYIFFSGRKFHGSQLRSFNIEKPSGLSQLRSELFQCKQNPALDSSCSEALDGGAGLLYHTSHCRRQAGVYTCSLCGKNYSTSTGLRHHIQTHEGRSFMCPICDSRFTRKGTVKRHMRAVHSSDQCVSCSAILRLGDEFNQHMIHCVKDYI